MKTPFSYLGLFFLMFCFFSESKGQNQASNKKAFYMEANLLLGEIQRKNYLFSKKPVAERAGIGFGGELRFGLTFKGNWNLSIGGSYFMQEFTSRMGFNVNYPNPNNVSVLSESFFVENLNSSFSNYDVSFTIAFDGEICGSPPILISDGEAIRLNFVRVNTLRQIGIPFRIEKIIGRKANKFYLSLGVAPTFVIGDLERPTYRNSNRVSLVNGNRFSCYRNNTHVGYFSISQENLMLKNYTLKDARVDLNTEIGLLHEGTKNTFKFGLFFNESISGFTTINEDNFQAQAIGVKFGLRKNTYKK